MNPPRKLSLAILSSSTPDLLAAALRADFQAQRAELDVWNAPFNQYRQELWNAQSTLYTRAPEVVMLYLEAEDLFADSLANPFAPREQHVQRSMEAAAELDQLLDLLQGRLPDALILLHTVYLRPLNCLTGLEHHGAWGIGELAAVFNSELARIARTRTNIAVHDTAALAAHYGYRDWFDARLWYLARCRLGKDATGALARSVGALLRGWQGHSRKCLVVDLDNTLWGGQIGEDGILGIALGPEGLGRAFLEFQIELLNLTRKGVLLAICSKNDPEPALDAIRNHPSMQLRENHFAAIRLNWTDKATNLRSIAAELNLGEESLVFVDDNPAERELVGMAAPAVLVPEWPRDPADFKPALIDLAIHEFPRLWLTPEDQARSVRYGVQRQRRASRDVHASLDQYFRSLEMRVRIGRAVDATLPRIAQLTQKTNQFNLTSKRYTEADVRRMSRDPRFLVLSLELRDRFGDEGLVGVLIFEEGTAGRWAIDSFLLSCRVIGRGVESAFLSRACEKLRSAGATVLAGEYIRTARNSVAADVYPRLGFTCAGDTSWIFDCGVNRIDAPDWIMIENAAEEMHA
jgi:FkbH-like protein